jgi:4-diphosphocytidyl-2-C-methyl-D-erythritol kinase
MRSLSLLYLLPFLASWICGVSEAFTLLSSTHRQQQQRRHHHFKATTGIETDTTTSSTSSRTLTLFSPCKINLFLRILRKRPDGYHDLASLFQAVGFGDTLELTRLPSSSDNKQDSFTCNMPGVPVDATNLVLRALQLMRTKTGMDDVYFQANLIKQVPAQAGLGGGSANAATAMWGANELMGHPATLEQVREYMMYLQSVTII